jgi:RNA polymerase sigma factor (sigma-70 family)
MITVVRDDVETYRRYAGELVRYATVLVGSADAADVVSEAMARSMAAAAWPTVENRRAYLYRAVLNEALGLKRSRTRAGRRAARWTSSRPSTAQPGDLSIDAERALATLSPQQRAVIFLTYWDDLTPAQCADLLGVSEGTVRKQLARGRDNLRKVLDA